MKRMLFLSFYFKPDLCAGSFRNSPLLEELARRAAERGVAVDVMTTLPQRYSTYTASAPEHEESDNLRIERISIPKHKSGLRDQILSFRTFFREVRRRVADRHYDMVYASSSRLFTAYLGAAIARERGLPLYLDIRDIFVDTMGEVIKNPLVKVVMLPILAAIERRTFSYASHINLISGGFATYFAKYGNARQTQFTNGIDDIFIEAARQPSSGRGVRNGGPRRIVYAGNIGEGQGLHKVVPPAAKLLGNGYEFRVIGDGGGKGALVERLKEVGADNVVLLNPMNREHLIREYHDADYLFLHLNDYDAFKRVLPSKIFELGVFDKPLIAGVSGHAADFLRANLPGTLLFAPGDYEEMVRKLRAEAGARTGMDREAFIRGFRRDGINAAMAESILACIP